MQSPSKFRRTKYLWNFSDLYLIDQDQFYHLTNYCKIIAQAIYFPSILSFSDLNLINQHQLLSFS